MHCSGPCGSRESTGAAASRAPRGYSGCAQKVFANGKRRERQARVLPEVLPQIFVRCETRRFAFGAGGGSSTVKLISLLLRTVPSFTVLFSRLAASFS